MPLAYPSTLDRGCRRRRASYVEELWSPESWHSSGMRAGESRTLIRHWNYSAEREEPFSLKRGLDTNWIFFKLGITSLPRLLDFALRNDEGDLVGRPRYAR